MASKFNIGESVFFVFRNGSVELDSQLHPRMYKSLSQLMAKCPGFTFDKFEVLEYGPIRKIENTKE